MTLLLFALGVFMLLAFAATAAELGQELSQKRGELAELFSKYKTETGEYDMPVEVAEECKKRNDELTELGKKWEQARDLEDVAKKNAEELARLQSVRRPVPLPDGKPAAAQPVEEKSVGQLFIEHRAYQERGGGREPKFVVDLPGVDVKTLMQRTAGYEPESRRTGRVVLSAQRQPILADLIPQDQTEFDTVRYMEETTFTNNATATAEGQNLGEAALAYTERSVPLELVGTWLPITGQQLDDVPGIRGLIDNRLMFMLEQAVENQLMNGTGASPQLTGFLNKPGILTQAKGGDPVPDAIRKAMTLVRVNGRANPSGVVLHPNDWQDIRLLRTADGIYIWGPPSEAGPERIWGLPVIETDVIPENTGLVGDFRMYSHISRKAGVTVETTDSHASDFIAVKYAIRIYTRLSLEIFRASAFATVTGI